MNHVVTADMAEHVQTYIDHVRDLVDSTGGTLLIEERLPIDNITGEADAYGTSDVVILTDEEIIVVDLKYGLGEKVDA